MTRSLLALFALVTLVALSAWSWSFATEPGELANPPFTIDTVAGSGQKANNGDVGAALETAVGQTFGVEIGPDGDLYVTEVENHRVRRVDLKTGAISTVAGNGKKGYSGDGGPATKASMNEPYEVRFDRAGNLYVVEMQNHIVRRVDRETGVITTVAGTGNQGYGGDDGPATKAQFSRPHSIALDGKGGLYIADIGNHRIRRVDLKSGIVRSIAGNGEKQLPVDGQLAVGKPMLGPRALTIQNDTMWIALREGHSVWQLNLGTGKLKHLAGSGKRGYLDANDDPKQAMFNGPKGIVCDSRGRAYVVDTENQVIRQIDPDRGVVTTIAGAGPQARGYRGDSGPARAAWMDRPHGICVDAQDRIYIGDTNNHRVRICK